MALSEELKCALRDVGPDSSISSTLPPACYTGALLEKLRTAELLPLASRIRQRLVLLSAEAEDLAQLLDHLLAQAGNPYAYLRRVFTELPLVQSLGDIEALLRIRLEPADLA
ncbi:MAG: hypothetical protein OXU81_09145 [Gammaproteobacteria bacterium]|nr:hypothetical protein [Gammaproteobacteria bacterium]